MSFVLESHAFAEMSAIPRQHTCDDVDEAPPLSWRGAPSGTESFALVVDDPDAPDPAAPKRVWVHWVVWDIPASTTELPAGGSLPPGAREGLNDGGRTGWEGPCPPIGRHRYFFKLYALDRVIGELPSPTKRELRKAMEHHVLGHAELIGTYERSG